MARRRLRLNTAGSHSPAARRTHAAKTRTAAPQNGQDELPYHPKGATAQLAAGTRGRRGRLAGGGEGSCGNSGCLMESLVSTPDSISSFLERDVRHLTFDSSSALFYISCRSTYTYFSFSYVLH